MKAHESSTLQAMFLPFLLVVQEILMLLPSNPPWAHVAHQNRLQELEWNDENNLQAYTIENTRLILSHSRLILSFQPARTSPPSPTHLNRKLFAKILQRRSRISGSQSSVTSSEDQEDRTTSKSNFQFVRNILSRTSLASTSTQRNNDDR
jgi:hypothetical protein